MSAHKLRAFFLDLLYPNRCDCCGERIRWDALLCTECAAALDALRVPNDAWGRTHPASDMTWDGCAAAYAYTGAARRGVLALKDGHRGFLQYAAAELADAVREMIPPAEISCVTWVPVTKQRRRTQGYAHAELLGRALAEALQCEPRGGLLTEQCGALRQHDLPAADRAIYARLRFQRTDTDLSGQTVLLVDDILTTGSTARKCTALLREMGAARVFVAAAACRLQDKEEPNESADAPA